MSRRAVVLLTISAMLTVPGAAGDTNVDVAWPSDLKDPYPERAYALAAQLDISLRYVTYRSESSWFAPLEGHPVYDQGQSSVSLREEGDHVVVDILHRDGTAFRYQQPFTPLELTREATQSSCSSDAANVQPTHCAPSPYEDYVARAVQPAQLPVGIWFEPLNRVHIEGPPGTFAAFGTGVAAAQAIAQRLGIPAELTAANLTQTTIGRDAQKPPVPHFATGWWGAPGVNQVLCDCVRWALADDDAPRGAGSLWFVVDRNDTLLQFGSSVWPASTDVTLSAQAVRDLVEAEFAAEGFNEVQTWSTPELWFLSHHGLVWRIWGQAAAVSSGVAVDRLMDASDGAVVAESRETVLLREPADPVGTAWFAALLVGGLALAVVLWRGGRRPDADEAPLPPPPRFEDEDPAVEDDLHGT